MPTSTISAKGQITLPAKLRRKLGIQPHDRLSIESVDDAIVIKRATDLFALEGFLGRALPRDEERRRTMRRVGSHARGRRE